MDLNVFDGQNKEELSMIEVAHAILDKEKKPLSLNEIVSAVQDYLNKSNKYIREKLPQFYTDLNTDGSFISLDNNIWGLREWYPYDSIDEEVNHSEENEESSEENENNNGYSFLSANNEVNENDNNIDDNSENYDQENNDVNDYDNEYDYNDSNEDSDELSNGLEDQLSEYDDDFDNKDNDDSINNDK